jgi:excisionase family DNA binding protein
LFATLLEKPGERARELAASGDVELAVDAVQVRLGGRCGDEPRARHGQAPRAPRRAAALPRRLAASSDLDVALLHLRSCAARFSLPNGALMLRMAGDLTPGIGLTRDEVMTAPEVADLLKMPVSTIYEVARRGELPARRLGRTWRFLRPRLEELLAS